MHRFYRMLKSESNRKGHIDEKREIEDIELLQHLFLYLREILFACQLDGTFIIFGNLSLNYNIHREEFMYQTRIPWQDSTK